MYGRGSYPLFLVTDYFSGGEFGGGNEANDQWSLDHPLLEKLTAWSQLPIIGDKPPVKWIASSAKWLLEVFRSDPNQEIDFNRPLD